MVNITDLITLREIVLAERLIMTSSFVIPSLIFDLILSFSSGGGTMYSSFLLSFPRFLAQSSVLLGESSD